MTYIPLVNVINSQISYTWKPGAGGALVVPGEPHARPSSQCLAVRLGCYDVVPLPSLYLFLSLYLGRFWGSPGL